MTFPVVATTATTADTSSGSVTVAMPAGIVAGDLLLVIWAEDVNGAVTQSGGSDWTDIDQGAGSGSACRGGCWAKIAAGSDSLTLASANSQDFACVALRITGHGVANVATDITKGTAATGSNAAPEPPNCDPGSAKDYLWIAAAASDDDDDTTPYGPASYTEVAQLQSANSTSSCLIQVASRELNATQENPGAFALAATEEWRAQTFAIPPSSTILLSTGRADETDVALALALRKSLTTRRADETDAALSLALRKSLATGAATETDVAFALALSKRLTTGRADETDSAFALSLPLIAGRADETDSALALALSKRLTTGMAVEIDSAFALALSKRLTTGMAVEIDSAFALSLSKRLTTGIATETDVAFALGLPLIAGRADETDSALALSLRKSLAVGTANETDAALALTLSKHLTTGRATESDAAFSLYTAPALPTPHRLTRAEAERIQQLLVRRTPYRAEMLSTYSRLIEIHRILLGLK